jgi:hypothetical protein
MSSVPFGQAYLHSGYAAGTQRHRPPVRKSTMATMDTCVIRRRTGGYARRGGDHDEGTGTLDIK